MQKISVGIVLKLGSFLNQVLCLHRPEKAEKKGKNMATRPDLAGTRIQVPNQPAIWLIDDDGMRHWIPDPPTYNNLFRDWNGVVEDINATEIDEGPSITSGAILARGVNDPAVYLISNGHKRWVTSPAAMDKFYFSWDRVQQVPLILLNFISSGPNIS